MAVGIAVHYCIMLKYKYFFSLGTESFLFLWSFVCVVLPTAGDMFDIVGAKYLLYFITCSNLVIMYHWSHSPM